MDQATARTTLPFDEDDLEENFDAGDLARAREVQRQGKVLKVSVTHEGRRIEGSVQGSEKRPYDVSARLEKHVPHQWSIESECTCPVGYLCKHAAALLLEALKAAPAPRLVLKPDRVDTARTVALARWLEELSQEAPTGPAALPKPAVQQICYLLKPPKNAETAPRIDPVVARPLKHGGYSPFPHDIGWYQMSSSYAQHVTAEDKMIAGLRDSGRGDGWQGSESLPTDPAILDLMLRKIVATGRAFFGTLEGPRLHLGEAREARLGWQPHENGTQSPVILVGDGDSAGITALAFASPWYFDRTNGEAGPLTLAAPPALVRRFLAGPAIEATAVGAAAESLKASGVAELIEPPRVIPVDQRSDVPPVPCLRLTQTAEFPDREPRQLALVHFDYDGLAAEHEADPPRSLRALREGRMLVIARDFAREEAFAARLNEIRDINSVHHRVPGVPRQRSAFLFGGVSARTAWLDFLHRHVPALEAEGWRVTLDDAFAGQFRFAEVEDAPVEAAFSEEESGGWWFSLDLGITIEGQRVPLLPLLMEAIRRLAPSGAGSAKRMLEDLSRQGFIYADLPDGRVAPLPFERVGDILATIVELFDNAPLNPDGTMVVSIDLATALANIELATKLRWLGGERLRALVDRLASFTGIVPVPAPEGLAATLRPYQEQGLAWLQFLREYGLGGILADDMGLGKTVQTLASLLVEKEAGRLDRPCLIVCPTSLIPNWQDEAARFAPGLKVLSLHGADRTDRFPAIGEADLVLSTYPLLPRDSETLLPVDWHMVVLDEAQAIKNPATRATQLVCQLKARHRLCLTGTPVENHLGEAWSHFAFLLPGMLGDTKRFNRLFRTPIEKHNDSERQAALARRLKPFILRRTKGEVLKELPPKTEIVRHVDLEGPQRDFYETLRLAMHKKVRDAVGEKGFNRSRIVILDALLKLRQACCDPRLVKLQRARKAVASAKLEALLEMLPEMIEEGRRVLLFSQFTSMLDLIKPELDRLAIPFVELRGDTTDRKTPVRRFQGGEVPLFLISLKAGGTGLNLTAADTVIHYDPWWNPAVEAQATDRAHRIGQDKNVFVHKLIACDTVEDRILALQDRKRAIGNAILGEGGEAVAPLGRDDLDFLFRGEL